MELGLSLGDTPKLPFSFLDRTNKKKLIKKDLGLYMGLSLNSTTSKEDNSRGSSDQPRSLDVLPLTHQQPSSHPSIPWLFTHNKWTGEEEEEEESEEVSISSPKSTVSNIQMELSIYRSNSKKRRYNKETNSDDDGEEEDNNGSALRKKLRLSKQQSAFLEDSFKDHHTLNPKQKQALAIQLNLRPRQVEVWFQNRRARTKLKQTQVDCSYLKTCCDKLTEENKRLTKELQELRALKSSQPLFNHLPPTTLTMCPSCEHVSSTTTTTTTATSAATMATTNVNSTSTNSKSTLNPFIKQAHQTVSQNETIYTCSVV